MQSIAQAAAALNGGAKSRSLIEECLARIGNKAGEGERAFLKVHAEAALAAADFHDRMRSNGTAVSHFAGIPISVKDLFDIAGDVTTAGTIVLVMPRPRLPMQPSLRACAPPESFPSAVPT